jgi:SHS2 domain-containing protein
VKILEFNTTYFRIKAVAYGEEFQIGKHPQGTEVKAITYSNMQVHENEGKCEVFVIIDI